MRKIIAAIFIIIIDLPLLVAAMSLLSVRISLDHAGVDAAMLLILAGSSAGLLLTALIVADNSRERVVWVGSALFVPSLVILVMGFAINSELVSNVVRYTLEQTHFDVTLYHSALTSAEAASPILRLIAGSFGSTGVFAALFAVLFFLAATLLPDPHGKSEDLTLVKH